MKDQSHCSCSRENPIDVLKAEHRVIERVLNAVERANAAEIIDKEFFLKAIDFVRNFADGCHHAKEEHELFPMMEARGVPRDGGPIGCMLDDHERGRVLIRTMLEQLDAAAGGSADAAKAVRSAASHYIELLRRHIWREDNVLFTMADRILDCGDRAALRAGFEHTEESAENVGKHERYLRLADELSDWTFDAPTGWVGGNKP
jgi:hemerythrin-like domain-containing protein